MKKQALLWLILVAITAFFIFDLNQYFSLDFIKNNQSSFAQYYAEHGLQTLILFFAVYVLVTGLSLPGALVLTLLGGALFGFWTGLLIISFASTLGATLAFLCARFLFRQSIENRFAKQLQTINTGIEKEGAFYLFSLRLVPLFPFFVINLAMGLTSIRPWTFYWISQLGMLAGTMVFVNAGTQLAQLESLSGILSPSLILSFSLLGLFPLLGKKLINLIKARQVYAGFNKPKRFDTNLVVIGAGSAGLVTSYIAAAVNAKVSLIEKHKMGGDCLNTGCVPSKALIRSARFIAEQRRFQQYGMNKASIEFSFSDVMERVAKVVKTVEPHDSIERYEKLGVDCWQGNASILSPYEVKVEDKIIRTANIVIATGARPHIPEIKNIESMAVLTSDNLWEIRQQPKRLLVLGGGPIGCELSQCFARLGSQVTMLLRGERLLPKEDPEVSEFVSRRFQEEGIKILNNHQMLEFVQEAEQKFLLCQHRGQPHKIGFDQVLVATGRQANVTGFGLENLPVVLRPNGTIEVNEFLQTNIPNIYACGDVTGPYQFTHMAAHQAWYVVVNALFGRLKRFRVDYSVVPSAIFTDPEVAGVGLNEQQAKQQGIAYEVSRFDLTELDRAIADGDNQGWVKVLTVPSKDKILGATIVGPHAGELISEFVTAMKHGLGLNKILATTHIYPTWSEANKYVAGEWKRANAPRHLLKWVEKFHRWQRSEK